MHSPLHFNEQQVWGGDQFPIPTDDSDEDKHEEATLIGHTQHGTRFHDPPQGNFIASTSDDLFRPHTGDPSTYTFHLPNIPFNPNPCYNAYNHKHHRILPPSTSYNNPFFSVPPLSSNDIPVPTTPLPRNLASRRLGPPPLIPPRPSLCHHHVFDYHSQSPFDHPAPDRTVHSQAIPLQPSYHAHSVDHRLHRSFSPSPSLPPSSFHTVSKTLPTVAHIPLLTSKHDFFPWDEGVHTLICANGLIGHILDPSAFMDPTCPDLCPTPPPVLSMSSGPLDIEASNRWWQVDNIVQHILVSRLGSVPRGLLPSSSTTTRTALSIYQTLLQFYGTCNFVDCTELLSSLHTSTCVAGRVPEFVSKWRVGLVKLQTARYLYNVKICISLFV